jgi:Xaa-Pro aminopeptidase
MDHPLEAGWVVTVEPGFYVVPSILASTELRERFSDVLHDETVASWADFGGIRIEDDVLVTDGDPEVLSAAAPKTVADIEALVGSGVPWNDLLS